MPAHPWRGKPFDLLSVRALARLRDREAFAYCLNNFYGLVAAQWKCTVAMSERRLGDAHDFWISDVKRTEGFEMDPHEEPGSRKTKIDHFKHASIIVFWLRRLVPINETWPDLPDGSVFEASSYTVTGDQDFFLQYGNEYCALMAGFFLIQNYEMQAAEERAAKNGIKFTDDDRREYVARLRLPERFKYEYPKLLKHKNISHHAIYMMYRSLVDAIGY